MTDGLIEEAADWADRLDALSPDDRAELGAWLNRSPAHRDALGRMVRLLGDPALFHVVEQAERASLSIPAPRPRPRRWQALARPANRRFAIGIAAALAAMAVAPVLWHALPPGGTVRADYASAVGQQRRVTLPDGSDMTLDAASRVAIAFSDDARDLTLQGGAARFEVRHDADRPFAVSTPEGQMVALGTNFSVDRGAGHSELRVYRGRVRLSVPGQAPVVVTAGYWAEAGRDRIALHRFDTAIYQGWQDRWLTGDRIRLGDAVARIGRYSPRPIRLADPALADETFNGRFRLDRPVESLTLIGALFDLSVREGPDGITLTRR
ncbi:transmembrane sensor [Sphingomonas sp. SORGH_AS870]|uniref:FecR family protein n=1 Tax=Sphingomonas sp. SORGH_AS_0870 TaxID=3041801 RepID=UPI002863CBD9|nr:FecR domain-containing protein [Sphingomonas sp. SORGH_AS_0870]MDR6145020.1 transmembrane sensor [Sphingomonas sp. SORGH_AS_0870]